MNKDSIERLWDEITPKLYGYLINTLKDSVLADDILQTTWLKAIEATPKYHDQGNFSAWLFAIARNEMRMHWRKSGREIPYDESLHDKSDASRETEDKILVEQILSKLSEDDRELIRLRYIGDLSFSEISRVLQTNPITARVRMHRALARAKEVLNN